MRYSKKHVNEILDQVFDAMKKTELGIENSHVFTKELELIREEHLLVDRRTTALMEYASGISADFLVGQLTYKELMNKYHCSYRKLKQVLHELAESDDRIYEEMEIRRR